MISTRLYDRESKEYGLYKVTRFVENRGKTEVPYYNVKFKDTGNEYKLPLHNIESNTVIDMKKKKRLTEKKRKAKKKEVKIARKEAKRFVIGMTEEPILLSLDLSTHSSGIAVFKGGKLIYYDYIYRSHNEKWDIKRINFMKCEIEKLIDKYNINCVALEDIMFKHKIALHVLSKLQGVICNMLYERNLRFAILTPIEWKTAYDINRADSTNRADSFGTTSREVSKNKTVICVNKDFGLDLEEEFKDSPKDLSEPCAYDVADAIAIGYVALRDRIRFI